MLAWAPVILDYGPAQFVRADDVIISVPGCSVPSLVRWDGDELPDLVVGEGVAQLPGKMRVYLNVGTPGAPQFSNFFYVQSLGADLTTLCVCLPGPDATTSPAGVDPADFARADLDHDGDPICATLRCARTCLLAS